MKTISNSTIKKTSEAAIAKSMVHSFRIENIVITDKVAANALAKVQLRLKKEQK